jgi:hypothetical protein
MSVILSSGPFDWRTRCAARSHGGIRTRFNLRPACEKLKERDMQEGSLSFVTASMCAEGRKVRQNEAGFVIGHG